MAFVKFQFYGRFLLAEEEGSNGPTGKTTFIAPRLGTPPLPVHRPMLTIPRLAIASADPCVPPTSRILTVAPQVPEGQLELLAWDLTGFDMRIVSSGGLRLAYDDPIPRLEELERLVNRPTIALDKTHLTASSARVASTIEIAGGQGSSSALYRNSAEFLTRLDAYDTTKTDTMLLGPIRLADFVEIILAGNTHVIELRRAGTTRSTTITLDVASSPSRVVGVTNLCATVPTNTTYDFEFGEYYECLQSAYDDRLVPLVRHLGDAADCDIMARVAYR